MAMLSHANHLEAEYGAGPHTISVPRLRPADQSDVSIAPPHEVDDATFKKLVAILRIAVPYTGMILSTRWASQCVLVRPPSGARPGLARLSAALCPVGCQPTGLPRRVAVSQRTPPPHCRRESPEMRRALLKVGMSQMSAGSRTDVGAYHRWAGQLEARAGLLRASAWRPRHWQR